MAFLKIGRKTIQQLTGFLQANETKSMAKMYFSICFALNACCILENAVIICVSLDKWAMGAVKNENQGRS